MKSIGKGLENALKEKLKQFSTKKVAKIGILENQTYEDGTSVAYVGTIHEFGAAEKNIKPRPFLIYTAQKKRKEWVLKMGKHLRRGVSIDIALKKVGEDAVGDVVETITKMKTPKLQDSTIQARLRRYKSDGVSGNSPDALLNDTGLLISSISSIVDDSEG